MGGVNLTSGPYAETNPHLLMATPDGAGKLLDTYPVERISERVRTLMARQQQQAGCQRLEQKMHFHGRRFSRF